MSTRNILKCDLCGKVSDTEDLDRERTLHINVKAGWKIWWRRGKHDGSAWKNKFDVCSECLDEFADIRRKKVSQEKDSSQESNRCPYCDVRDNPVAGQILISCPIHDPTPI